MWSKTVVVGLCLLLFVLVFIIFMYLQGIEVPNVAFGLAKIVMDKLKGVYI